MACYAPVKVNILRNPIRPGGRRIQDKQEVPCGKCTGCIAEKAKQWAVRLFHEAQVTTPAIFVTLTYDEANIPEYHSLSREDATNFLKRLRKEFPPRTVRYYLCGEYGDTTQRPHYHAIVFGCDFADRTTIAGSTESDFVWESPTLTRLWGKGNVEFSRVTWESVSYVAGYVHKKVHRTVNPDHYLRYTEYGELVELEKEFSSMSRRPAIGLEWLKKYWPDVYPRDHVTVNGRKLKPPRYYDKAFEDPKHDFIGISYKDRMEMLLKVKYERWDPDADHSPETLRNREINHKAKLGLTQRRNKV